MIKEKLKTRAWDYLIDENPDLDDSLKYPKFRKGDIVWLLKESRYRTYNYDRYGFMKMIIANGEPLDDDSYGWGYILDEPEYFTTEADYYDSDYDYSPQIHMFETLKELKEFAKSKVRLRMDALEVQIDHIDSFKDEKEYREEQIDCVIEE